MRIITVFGSPRRKGNTALVLGWIEEHLRAAGHAVDRIDMLNYRVGECVECKACKRNHAPLCILADDANALFRRMAEADLVLFAAPVFCWGFPVRMKGLIDRMFCMMDYDGRREGVPRLYDKPLALMMTGGGERTDNADLVFRGFHHCVGLLFAREAGEFYVPDCTEPDKIGDDVKRQAIAFAEKLTTP
jgi:multimeric flavodoxin WrbA